MENCGFKVLRRDEPGYEEARRGACWNGFVPERYPEIIAYPEQNEHVEFAVQYARSIGMSVIAKSGGHSWTASFLREGGMLLDMVNMKNFTFDKEQRTAEVQPACHGADLNAAIMPHGLMFPGGHCPSVGIGGFLLQGGFGWNSRKWGIACESVTAIDVVNAEGKLIHADENENSDFYWAARGAGCGYFGVVCRFYLKLHVLPTGIMYSRYILPVSALDELYLSMEAQAHKLPRSVEVGTFIGRDQDGFKEPTIAFYGDALSETEEEALEGLKIMDDLPVIKQAMHVERFQRCTLKTMLGRFEAILDNRGRHYNTDNFWSDSPVVKLLPAVKDIIATLPPAPSHLFMLFWFPEDRELPDMAFSMQSKIWMSLYAISDDAADDKPNLQYVVDRIRAVDEWSTGTQLADENLPGHPAKFMQVEKFEKLERLRAKHDPEGRFFTYLRVPRVFEDVKAKISRTKTGARI
ncbi:FAD-dependent oxidoreductase [Teratosphaeria destructans]|uniref:FAD-dependent oxidoreductase n=1 Tax=Teratosphaeria destructans TaxID=418781 RepID=A0A9W7W6N2_9PEZI|nr:FAD-dependent oxidoreductase [Teratosphaeria destructans]